MTFITIIVPAIIAAAGLYFIVNFSGTGGNDNINRSVCLSIGSVLLAAGLYFEFLVSPMSSAEIILRVVVLLTAVGVVLASEIAKGIEASCGTYSTGDVCAAIYSVKAARTACFVMTLVISSIAAAT